MGVDLTMLAFLLAVAVIGVMWWVGWGHEWMRHNARFCLGCRRMVANCSCPLEFTFTAWADMSEDERNEEDE